MVYREAIGNETEVEVSTGTLINDYPILVKAYKDKARFSVTGGLGYVPVSISNLSTYRNPQLYWKEGGKWKKVNQQVQGKDFWQTEYNNLDNTWEITFNVNLDSKNDERLKREFKFEIN